ncbi:hypothetical protein C5167_021486 [Papaver somniferum]|uniref:peptidyl-prolyl cis-trans isomerase CYP59-like n=1 Tax=Papaver somniferum TaxID=3469 RepID=UPI000E7044C7|nr:peptidyl-prolyl cis-trans isomerase CYP59-like [Papaver somniferum]XP_026445352.1 peptidyl-prolyl cis-trans isomerase CYP59-like [Papaver somniferum]RZC94239.1 hypothetical protein C5167_021486 [Papaver somniferum]
MSVMITTSLGDIVIDLHTDRCPVTTKNFLKLCKIKYFNGCLFHTIQKDFTAQTGDPTGKGDGGDSIYKFLYGDQARFFGDEIHQDLKHSKTGTVAMASGGEGLNASQFYFTLRDDLDYLDGKHTVFGEVAEGLETLTRINEAYLDEKGRPYKNIRIKHTYILDDPFDDPPQLASLIPDASPEGKPLAEIDDDVRLEDDWVPMDEQLGAGELEEVIRQKEAHSSAVVLESIGDIPDADMKPPENVLFVCKLNPVTEDEDLNTIFSRFGTVVSAEVIRDFKTGDSLNYAFIEFETNEACEQAYFKMDNALIDDRRIHVDFSQSVSKLWGQYRRKEHQTGKGRGCFKCGSLDHMAKDCTGDPSVKAQNPKYVLKDGNSQRGGNENYEMVFEGDTTDGSGREKRREERDSDKDLKKRRVDRERENDLRHKGQDTRNDKSRHDDRSRGRDREDESYRGSRHGGSRRPEDDKYEKERLPRDSDHKTSRNDVVRVGDRDYRNTDKADRRSESDNRNRESDSDSRRPDKGVSRGDSARRDKESSRDYMRNDKEGDRRGENDRRNKEGERDYRRTDKEGDRRSESDRVNKESEGGRRKDRDYRKHDSGEGGRRRDRDHR